MSEPDSPLRLPTFEELRASTLQSSGSSALGATSASDSAMRRKFTPEQQKLLDHLEEVNGQDAYSNEAIALGVLKRDEYLLLPNTLLGMVTPADKVGDGTRKFKMSDLIQVYALNKTRAPTGANPIRFALLRMEAVAIGWVSDQKEITYVAPDPNAEVTFSTDLKEVDENIGIARLSAFLVPLVAEHTFRTTGHHYISSTGGDYERRYNRTINACLASQILSYLPASSLYHAALHWVSPFRVREVLEACLDEDRIPEAIRLRVNAAPAGTAIVTTTAAVIEAMKQSKMYDEVKAIGIYNLDLIETMSDTIKSDAPAYHKVAHAYGKTPLPTEKAAKLDEAKKAAIVFSPIAQAFINAFYNNSSLGLAMALKKHADQNPSLVIRATRYFRDIGSVRSKTLHEVVDPKYVTRRIDVEE